jgi:hypothetical protein
MALSCPFVVRLVVRDSNCGSPESKLMHGFAVQQDQLYTLEGFLARLAQSPYLLDQLILEGRVLLAAYDRRPTGDSDAVLEPVRRVARLPADDGLTFDTIEAIGHPSNCGDTQQ